MINSMTGYGQAQGEVNGTSFAIEIKTVNSRYFRTIIKLPEMLMFLEDDIEKLLRKSLSRGTANYVVRLKEIAANSLFEIDDVALGVVVEKLKRAAANTGIKETFDLGGLLHLPGIVQPLTPEGNMAGKIREAILRRTTEAIGRLKEMRSAEGKFLEKDLQSNCRIIEQNLEQISSRSSSIVHEYAIKLRQRVDKLLSEAELKLDEETLSREVAVFADRSDISEEIARMESHLQQFLQTCQSDTQAGRRLDFITQEMLREANTMASKTSDIQITNCVVDIKCRIERIKEQVQNIE